MPVYYRDGGNPSGPPVLYLHGGPGEGSADFEAFQEPYLRDTVRLVTLDQRGALRSPPVEGTITLDQLLADIEGLRTTLNIGRWHVVGHLWGGWLASAYAWAGMGIAWPVRCWSVPPWIGWTVSNPWSVA